MVRFIILVCAFAALFAIAYANDETFKCYTCLNCNGDGVKEESKECTTTDKKCRTIELDGAFVHKDCGVCVDGPTTAAPKPRYARYARAEYIYKCTECDGSECNSAASHSSSLFIGVVGAMLLKYYY